MKLKDYITYMLASSSGKEIKFEVFIDRFGCVIEEKNSVCKLTFTVKRKIK